MIKEILEDKQYLLEAIILLVLSIYSFVISFFIQTQAFLIILEVLATLLSLGAVWVLFLKRHFLASYLILGLVLYWAGLYEFIAYLLSLNFANNMVVNTFRWPTIILALGSIYIIYFIIYHFKREEIKFNKDNFYLDHLIIVFALFAFLLYGLMGFVYVVVVELIAINYKKESSLLLMLSKAIIPIFILFNKLVISGFNNVLFFDIVLVILAVYTIVLIVLKAVSLKSGKELVTEIED